MRKLAIAMALASTALATPAVARDNSWYVGVEAGPMLVEDTELDYEGPTTAGPLFIDEAITIDHKMGFDVDVIGGYDFGGFRVEGEVAYKRAGLDELSIDPRITGASINGPFDLDGDVSVISGMFNFLLDFGDDDGWSGYVGPGIGLARVNYDLDSTDGDFGADAKSDGLAWQVVAGVRTAVSTPSSAA